MEVVRIALEVTESFVFTYLSNSLVRSKKRVGEIQWEVRLLDYVKKSLDVDKMLLRGNETDITVPLHRNW